MRSRLARARACERACERETGRREGEEERAARRAFLTIGSESPDESEESRWMNSGWKAMSTSSESLRYVRAMQIALVAWLHDCGPTAIRHGHSTGMRACAAIS
jgi:hypothetical protein